MPLPTGLDPPAEDVAGSAPMTGMDDPAETSAHDLTKDLMRACDRVQARIHVLEEDNRKLRATLTAKDSTRELQKQVERLEREKQQWSATKAAPAAYSRDGLALRGLEVDVANLANLVVTANWIHGSLTPKGVNNRLRDILQQIVGAQAYVVYLRTSADSLVPIAVEGLRLEDDPAKPAEVALEVAQTGISKIGSSPTNTGTLNNPVAVIPLTSDGHRIGVLSLVRLLPHKTRLSDLDYEIFQLLGPHAATALVAAGLFAQAGLRLPSPDAFHTAEQRG